MNAVKITQKLEISLIDYLSTTFDANKDGKEPDFANEVRKGFSETNALFKGPFLEMVHPYITGKSLQDLCDQGIISKNLLSLPCFNLPSPEPLPPNVNLYLHQQKAIEKIAGEGKGVVISSGTSSGKTEAFIIPILNDLCIDQSPGVRVLIIYPLNALVNDQLERFRKILKGTNITFGKYTGELPEKLNRTELMLENEVISREEIRQGKLPQILITNYAMLEYLLLRPEDSTLFDTGLWKFLVLDEAHTYNGAQGIEVAMLVRRLKERLNKKPGDLCCIATSATLINDDLHEAVEFAENLFGETFTKEDIIMGEVKKHHIVDSDHSQPSSNEKLFLHPKFEQLIALLREYENEDSKFSEEIHLKFIELLFDIGFITESNLIPEYDPQKRIPELLYPILIRNSEINKLKNWLIEQDKPVSFDQACNHIFPTLESEEKKTALHHLIEIGASAKLTQNAMPILPIKYHLFARPPQGIWACINSACPGKKHDTNWSKIYSYPIANCDSCEKPVFPVVLCRECGQHFLVADTEENGSSYHPAEEFPLEGFQKRFLTWKQIEEDRSLGENSEEDDDDDELQRKNNTSASSGFVQEEPIRICLDCGSIDKHNRCGHESKSIPIWEIKQVKVTNRKGSLVETATPIESINECPRCRAKSKPGTEVATPIIASGLGPLGNLTYELYRELPPSTDPKARKIPGEGRKLLTFYDSRQGAARFAAYLQDITNKQIYRHVIPIAIEECKKKTEWNDGTTPNLISLSKKAGEIALTNYLLANDPDFNTSDSDYLENSQVNRENSAIKLAKIILGEFTTGRKGRQSLESIGRVGVFYFNEEEKMIIADEAKSYGLNGDVLNDFISTLLDDMRYKKAVRLPNGIYPDDAEFGLNKGNPTYIRTGRTIGQQQPWIGTTDRSWKLRYTQIFLQKYNLDNTMEDVRSFLRRIWDLLVEKIPGLFHGIPQDGYRLNHEHIFFESKGVWSKCKRCQRLSFRSSDIPCGFQNCGGDLEIIDVAQEQENNYYYQTFIEDIVPIRIEEHTAQLNPVKGQEYQNKFKSGKINVLSCSTTFEMGINLGDLQAVALSNVPPSVANYRQRAGRAGRNKSGTSFIFTWASDRPHDQAYFDDPAEIINGAVRVPKIALSNELIARRHINALLLGDFLRFRYKNNVEPSRLNYCGEFFKENSTSDPHILFLDEWKERNGSNLITRLNFLNTYLPEGINHLLDDALDVFITQVFHIYNEKFKPLLDHYNQRIDESSSTSNDSSLPTKTRQEAANRVSYFSTLISRLEGSPGSTQGLLIDYLSKAGLLPSYSFPLNTVELMIFNPKDKYSKKSGLRLERDLRQAIREYAPGSEIVADKRIWKSQKPIFWNDTPAVYEYRICLNCQQLEIADGAGKPLNSSEKQCPVCGEHRTKKDKIRKYVVPDAFLADPSSGKPAKQYVNIEEKQFKSALIPKSYIPEEHIGKRIAVAFNETGELLHVNEGKFGKGYSFKLSKFDFEGDEKSANQYSLGFKQTTNTLQIRFLDDKNLSAPTATNRSFWLSMLYAIIQGACHSLQIERRDINGVLFPQSINGKLSQTLVIYDNVPGGAGHVKNIKDNLLTVLEEARKTLNCDDCAPDTSCYRCLKDYDNQYYHNQLKRHEARDYLDLLVSEMERIEDSITGAYRIASPNLLKWTSEKVRYAKNELFIAIDDLLNEPFLNADTPLLDLVNEALLKNIKVSLGFTKPIPQSAEGSNIKSQLAFLKDKGLKIYSLQTLPPWQVIIDPGLDTRRALKLGFTSDYDSLNLIEVISTIHSESVQILKGNWNDNITKELSANDLKLPDNTRVIKVPATYTGNKTEKDFFAGFFEKPVKKMIINDAYLSKNWVIKERLKAYLDMANGQNTLEQAIIHTKKDDNNPDQAKAFNWLNETYPGIISVKYTAEHDRSIEVTRVNGEKARIIIGRGIDFIDQYGNTKPTFIIIEDPMQ